MRIHLASTRVRRIRSVYPEISVRSPELKFLYTLCIWIRVDARIRIFLYTLTSQYQNQSFSARALLINPLRCPDTNRIRVDGRIRFVWTQIFLYPHKKKNYGYKNLRIRMDGA